MLILSRNCCFHRSRELKILNFFQWSTNHGTLHGSHYNMFSGFLRNLQSHAWPPEGSHWAIQISQNYSPISFQFPMKVIISLWAIWDFSGTNGPRVKDQEITAHVSSTFSKSFCKIYTFKNLWRHHKHCHIIRSYIFCSMLKTEN